MSNDTETLTLAAFLEARLAEDEAVARALQAYVAGSPGSYISLGGDHPELAAGDCPSYLGDFDPARVLADVAAKRRIVEFCTDREFLAVPMLGDPPDMDRKVPTGYQLIMAWLAAPYASHPDFRPEWAQR